MIKYRKQDLFRKFGIGSRLLEVLYVKSKKKTQVQICLFEVPICLGAEMSHIGDEVSWCRFVPVPKCLEFVNYHPENYIYTIASFQLLF